MKDFEMSCPLPIGNYSHVVMAHGGGGHVMNALIEKMFLGGFDNPYLSQQHDGASLEIDGARLAFTTDSYVVKPIFFPGGDIGSLAIHGTVNDLAMCGARPLFLSSAFILEEGFPMESLQRIVASMKRAADAAGALIVTGDTKTVDHGKGDGIYISMAGIGRISPGVDVSPARVQVGDAILINGDLGRHGIAILSARDGLGFECELESDCADLSGLVQKLVDAGLEIHCMRDLTRGGLASALNEISRAARVYIEVEEEAVPVCETVRAACEILGFDPLYVANEGRFALFLPEREAEKALGILHDHPLGKEARLIGRVGEDSLKLVALNTPYGVKRVLDMLSGEQLPRIC